jgi:glycosyltransferase involved in cell wall biosynthesis
MNMALPAPQKVLAVAPSAYILGGLATWLDDLLPALPSHGWDPVLGLVQGPSHHRPDRYLEAHPAARWIGIPCRTGTPEGRRRAIRAAIRKTRPHVVLGVNIPDTYTAAGRRPSSNGEWPQLAMSLHGIQPDLYDDIREFAGVLDGVIATNRLACALAERVGGLSADRVHYAPYGVPDHGPAPTRTAGDRLRIAYVGRLEAWQKRVADIPTILDRLSAQLVPFHLTIAGDGPEEGALRTATARWIEGGHVRFTGRLDREPLRELYEKTDVLLITSEWETGPLVAWEAAERGVALATSRYVGLELEGAMVDGENALVFNIGDVGQAAEHLRRLWHDPDLRGRLGVAARRLVLARYTSDLSARSWAAALRRVAESPPRVHAPPRPRTAGGLLDRFVGPVIGEWVRAALGPTPVPPDPGGEWPHSYGRRPPTDHGFWEIAREAERAATRR